jgi:general secretion pathway protein F
VETALNRGQPIEEMLVSISQSRDQTMGARFHLLAAWLEDGLRLGDALSKVPRLLPPQILAMLKAGQQIGDVKKVLPACRQLLKDAVSQTRGAINYLVILTFVITPASFVVFSLIAFRALPMFSEIAEGMAGTRPTGVELLVEHRFAVLAIQAVLMLLLWLAAFIYAGGPRVISWLPILDRIYYRLPWRRKRMQRDFSAILAILLDAGVPEPEAVSLAAACTANAVFQHRARRAVESLKQGLKLTEAVQAMDDAGEFRWRLTNASHAHAGFLQALAGWHEALDAKAFQQEQAAAHGVTTTLVLLNGLFVGAVAITVFMFLVSILNAGILW